MNKINALSKETFKLYDTTNVVLPAELIIYIGCCEEFLKLASQVSALCLCSRLMLEMSAWQIFMVANLYFQKMKSNNCVIPPPTKAALQIP